MPRSAKWELTLQSTLCSGDIVGTDARVLELLRAAAPDPDRRAPSPEPGIRDPAAMFGRAAAGAHDVTLRKVGTAAAQHTLLR